MMSWRNRSSEPVEVEKADDALKQASVVEEQAWQAIEKAQMMERWYLEMMRLGNQNSEPMDDDDKKVSVVLVNNLMTKRKQNETPNNNDLYSMNMSEKGKGHDMGNDGWEDDEQLEESVGPKVPSSYDKKMTTGDMDFNGRITISDELSPKPEVCFVLNWSCNH